MEQASNEDSSKSSSSSPFASSESVNQSRLDQLDNDDSVNSLKDAVSEKLLGCTDFQNNLATTINRVLESTTQNPDLLPDGLEEDMLQKQLDDAIENIIGITEKDPIFSEIFEQIVDKAEESKIVNKSLNLPKEPHHGILKTSTPHQKVDSIVKESAKKSGSRVQESRMRLRPRSTKVQEKPTETSPKTKKNQRKTQVKVLSNETYEGPVPGPTVFPANPEPNPQIPQIIDPNPIYLDPNVQYFFVQNNQDLMFPNHPFVFTGGAINNMPIVLSENLEPFPPNLPLPNLIPTQQEMILDPIKLPVVQSEDAQLVPTSLSNDQEDPKPVLESTEPCPDPPQTTETQAIPEKITATPKLTTIKTLMTKCSSTPRRSHVRVLNFTTPGKPIPTPTHHANTDSKLNKTSVDSPMPEADASVWEQTIGGTIGTILKPSNKQKLDVVNKLAKELDNVTPKVPKKTKRKRILEKSKEKVTSEKKTEENTLSPEEHIQNDPIEKEEGELDDSDNENHVEPESKDEDATKTWQAVMQTFKSKDWDNQLRETMRTVHDKAGASVVVKKKKPIAIKIDKTTKTVKTAKPTKPKPSEKIAVKSQKKKAENSDSSYEDKPTKKTKAATKKSKPAAKILRRSDRQKSMSEQKELETSTTRAGLELQNNLNASSEKENQSQGKKINDSSLDSVLLSNDTEDPETTQPEKLPFLDVSAKTEEVKDSKVEKEKRSKSNSPPGPPKKRILRRANKKENTNQDPVVSPEVAETPLVEPQASVQSKSTISPPIATMSRLEDSYQYLETPMKEYLLTGLPKTPRFLVPGNTPMVKNPIQMHDTSLASAIKVPDIPTPNFAITPGCKITPERVESPKTFSNRPTDYSSSSSYYKPDESDDIDKKLDALLNADRMKYRSECEQAVIDLQRAEGRSVLEIKTPIKIDNPVVLERVKSFSEQKNIEEPPHYTFVETDQLMDSSLSSDEDNDDSSSSSCSSCSTSSSDSDMDISDKEDKDWENKDQRALISETNFMIDDQGQIRFPLRNWVTPKKVDALSGGTSPLSLEQNSRKNVQISKSKEPSQSSSFEKQGIKESLKCNSSSQVSVKTSSKDQGPLKENKLVKNSPSKASSILKNRKISNEPEGTDENLACLQLSLNSTGSDPCPTLHQSPLSEEELASIQTSQPEPKSILSPESQLQDLEQKRLRTLERIKSDQTKIPPLNTTAKKKVFRIPPTNNKIRQISPSKRKISTPRKCIEVNAQPLKSKPARGRSAPDLKPKDTNLVVLNSGRSKLTSNKMEAVESLDQIALHVTATTNDSMPDSPISESGPNNGLIKLSQNEQRKSFYREVFGDSTDSETNPTPVKVSPKKETGKRPIDPKQSKAKEDQIVQEPPKEASDVKDNEEEEEEEEENKIEDCELFSYTEESSNYFTAKHNPDSPVVASAPIVLDPAKTQMKIYLEDNGFARIGLTGCDIYEKRPEKPEDKPKTSRGSKK